MSFDGERALSILKSLSFTRLGGSEEERRAADILCQELESIGLTPKVEEFEVWTYSHCHAELEVLEPYGKNIDAAVVGLSGNTPLGGLSAPLKYVESGQVEFLSGIKDTIILSGGFLDRKSYERAIKKGALAAIIIGPPGKDLMNLSTCPDYFERYGKLPSVFVKYLDGLEMVKNGASSVRLVVSQKEFRSNSRNVICDIEGTEDPDEIILVGAHFDSVPLTEGAHDNAAGSATILEMARYFKENPPKRTLRFVWFGSEELGLLGSFDYVKHHKNELKEHKFMVNVDVAGGIIGNNSASVMALDKLVNYLDIMGKEMGIGLRCSQRIYSGDCIPIGDEGIPSVTFARGGGGTYYLHSSGDEMLHIDAAHLKMLGGFILEFTRRLVDAAQFPVDKEIPGSIKKSMKEYLEDAIGKPPKDRDDKKTGKDEQGKDKAE